jgi:hypothetical protein
VTFNWSFIKFISLPDYDIAGGISVGCVVSGFPAAPTSSSSWQFGRKGLETRVNIRDSGANRGVVGPQVGVETLGGLGQTFTLFGSSGPACNPMAEF